MNSNHATPPPTPGPFCAIVDPLLSLLALGELEPEDTATANEHLATCAWCRERLREYETVHVALHRTYAPPLPDASPAIRWGEIAGLEAEGDEVEGDGLTLGGDPEAARARTHLQLPPHGRRAFSTISALAAAVLVIVLLSSLLGWQHRIGASPPPTPTLDPQTRTYVTLLHNYYQPVYVAAAQDTVCEAAYGNASASAKMDALLACRSTSAAVASAAHVLADHLQTAVPPVRWQTAHDDLKAAAQATTSIYTARVAAIDAHNTSQFDALILQTHAVLAQYCGPITLINAGLPASDGLNTPNLTGC